MVQLKQSLNRRYVIERPLGRGGMAQVFEATDSVLGRPVAVKILSERFAHDQTFVGRFRREAMAAAGLNHPGIVSVYDTGSDDSVHFIVMERIEGRTLADVLGEVGRLAAPRACEIAAAAADALAFAHEHGVVHRDVKPGNIMIADEGTVKVMDFGIARAVTADTATQTATVLGTAAYLSPEQARGERVDHRSDIYSLGVVLYEMLTGDPPFAGDSAVAVAYKHVSEDPTPPGRVTPDVPGSVEAAVMRALAKDPDLRHPSAADMAADLRRPPEDDRAPIAPPAPSPDFTTGSTEVIPARPTTEPFGPSRSARRWAWTLAAVALALGLAAGIVVWALMSRGEPASEAGAAPVGRPASHSPGVSGSPAFTGSPTSDPSSVDEAVAQFEALLANGVESGQITDHAAADIQHRVQEGVREYLEHGDLEKGLEKLAEADQKVDEMVEKGEISSSEYADSLHQAISAIRAQMQASPPVGEDHGDQHGNEGTGGGEGGNSGAGGGGRGGGPGEG